jgi:hypothetical protein
MKDTQLARLCLWVCNLDQSREDSRGCDSRSTWAQPFLRESASACNSLKVGSKPPQ